MRCLRFCSLLLLALTATAAAEGIDVRSKTFSANIRAGSVVGLTASDGTQYVCRRVNSAA